jgi:hypothetical protein
MIKSNEIYVKAQNCITYVTTIVRSDHRNNDAILISSLTSISCEYFYFLPILKNMGKQLDLLPIQRNDAKLVFPYATSQQCLHNLTNKFGFDRVLHEIAHPRVGCRYSISIDEHGFTAVRNTNQASEKINALIITFTCRTQGAQSNIHQHGMTNPQDGDDAKMRFWATPSSGGQLSPNHSAADLHR